MNLNAEDLLHLYHDREPQWVDTPAIARAVFEKNIAKIIYEAGVVFENSPLTYAQVKTLIDGTTIGGHKISDCDMVINLHEASKFVIASAKSNSFTLSRDFIKQLNAKIAYKESLEWGVFRGEGQVITDISIAGTTQWQPLKTERYGHNLIALFEEEVPLVQQSNTPWMAALKYFLIASYRQYFFDGNKRTALWASNTLLMSYGIRPLGIRQCARLQFNELMLNFYESGKMQAMLDFLTEEWHVLHATSAS